jgi:Dihydrodipicolinate synthase/N-acetylneuraminate lyase
MVTPPHYLFNAGDEGNYLFYRRIYERTGMPIIVYNVVPWNVVSVNVLEKLAKERVIVGVKQSGGDIHALGELLIRVRDVPILTALDDMLYPSFVMGASGSIAAVNTILPRTSVRLFNSVLRNDHKTARYLHERILPIARSVIQQPDMPTRIKYIMNNAGWRVGYPRKPLPQEPRQDVKDELLKLVKQVKELEEGG